MTVYRLNARIEAPDQGRVAKTIKPSQQGAVKFARLRDSELLCMRYRETPEGAERGTTIARIVVHVGPQTRL